jgi:hypothetical protein
MAANGDEPAWKPTVDAVRKYYHFLANDLGAIPLDCIAESPEGGWPDITQKSLAGLEKTEAVIELLRHLPYIVQLSKDLSTQIAFGTSTIDYRGYEVAEGDRFRYIPEGNKEFPPHVVVLTTDDEAYYGSLLLIDTERGLW